MNKDIRFYDTSSLLLAGESLFEQDAPFVISSITFKELERIKSSANKDADIKYSARLLLHLLENHPDFYKVVIHKLDYEDVIRDAQIDINTDTMILSDAIYYNNEIAIDEVIFVTNDLSLKHIASLFFGNLMLESIPEEIDTYTGYADIIFDSDDAMAKFYQDTTYNHFNLMRGQYLILRDKTGNVIDTRVWTGSDHRYLKYGSFESIWLGTIKPYEKDIYQKLAFDSLMTNKLTMIKGPAGSGKSLISLGYLMSKVEKGELDKVLIFCNTVATANSAKLGFLPGTKDEKLLDSQIGHFLVGKFGGQDAIDQLLEDGKLVLLPMSDIRGYDTTGMRAGIYITEAQNLDRTLLKLALQRVGEDCICIIDGDEKTQVDMIAYEGHNNGMRRASKAYRGTDIYGEVTLKNIYRSEIARIADNM